LIDRPEAGSLVVTNCVFSTLESKANSVNLVFGYNTELTYPTPQSSPTFHGCKFYFSRSAGATKFWILNAAPFVWDLSDPTNQVFWVPGSQGFIARRDGRSYGYEADAIAEPWTARGEANLGLPGVNAIYATRPPAPRPASVPVGTTVAFPPLVP